MAWHKPRTPPAQYAVRIDVLSLRGAKDCMIKIYSEIWSIWCKVGADEIDKEVHTVTSPRGTIPNPFGKSNAWMDALARPGGIKHMHPLKREILLGISFNIQKVSE